MNPSRREEILDHAMDLIIDEGIAALTMKKVAERVGFTEPAMYRHFRNKQDLVIHLVRRTRDRFTRFHESCDPSLPPAEFLREFLLRLLTYLDEVRGVTVLFLSESAYNRDEEIRAELEMLVAEQTSRVRNHLEQARRRRQVRPEVDPAAAAVLFMGIVQALTIRHVLGAGHPPIPEGCDAVLDVFLRGVLA